MAVKRWAELKAGMSKERRDRIEERAKASLLDMELREVRRLAGKTQAEMARALSISQGQVSETERRDDHRLSTLRRYVEALGGELEIIASFGDKQIRLRSA